MQLDPTAELSRYAQRRMEEHLKPTDDLLVEWGKWMRSEGMKAWPDRTMLAKVIEEGLHGASQSGAWTAPVPLKVAKCEWCVLRLRWILRRVLEIHYILMPAHPKEVQRRAARMGEQTWNKNLNLAREKVASTYELI